MWPPRHPACLLARMPRDTPRHRRCWWRGLRRLSRLECTDPRKISLRKGARQDTVEAPQVWDNMTGHTLARVVEKWERQGHGIGLPGVGPRPSAEEAIEPMHAAEVRGRSTHVTWVGDIFLIATML